MKPEMNRSNSSKYRSRDFSRPVLVPLVMKQKCVLQAAHGHQRRFVPCYQRGFVHGNTTMKPEMNRSKYRSRDFSRPVLVPQVIKQTFVLQAAHGHQRRFVPCPRGGFVHGDFTMKRHMNRSKYRSRDFSRHVLVPLVIKQRCVLQAAHGHQRRFISCSLRGFVHGDSTMKPETNRSNSSKYRSRDFSRHVLVLQIIKQRCVLQAAHGHQRRFVPCSLRGFVHGDSTMKPEMNR